MRRRMEVQTNNSVLTKRIAFWGFILRLLYAPKDANDYAKVFGRKRRA